MRPTDEEEYQEILEQYEQDQRDNEEYNEMVINFEIKKELQKIKKREYSTYYRAINNDKCICEKCGGHYTKLSLKAHLNTKKHITCLDAQNI